MDRQPSLHALLAHAGFVRAIARGLLRDEHDAEDVVQETFLAALEHPPADRGKLRAWLGAVGRRRALKTRRAERRRKERERVAARPEAVASFTGAVARMEIHRKLVEAVLCLDEPYRSTIIFRYFDELSPKDIARQSGVPVRTVKTRLQRARELLRGRLDRTYDGDRRSSCLALVAVAGLKPRTAAAALSSKLKGVMIMNAKAKTLLALLLVAGTLLTLWQLASERQAARRSETGRTDVATSATEIEVVNAPSVTESPPADLAAVDRDRDVFGVVVDPAGVPVAGARVGAVAYPGRRAGGQGALARLERPGPSATTRDDGAFVIRLTRGELVTLRAEAQGFATIEMDKVQAGENVRLVLGRPVKLRVIVRGPDGNPVPAVYVRVQRLPIRDPFTRVREGVTNGAGRCTFDELPGGCHAFVLVDGADVKMVELPEEGETEHVATVPVSGISGRVTDAATGAPIVGAVVRSHLANGPGVRTDADGRYRLPAAKDFVLALSEEHARQVRAVEGRTMDFELHRGSVARGRLVDAGGHAVAGALVWAAAFEGRLTSMRDTHSDDAGRFDLRGLHPRLRHTLVVTARGFGRWLLDFPAGDFDFGDLVLPIGRSIEGRLLDEEGKPAARARIELRGANKDRGRLLGITGLKVRYGSVEQRRTDDLGRFRFPGLAPGRYRLTTLRRSPKAEREVQLTAERDVWDADLSWASTRDFRVHVHDEAGQPLARVVVQVNRQTGITNRSGVARFRFAGEVKRISVSAVSSRQAPPFLAPPPIQKLAPGLTEYRFTVIRAGEATGRAVDASGKPLRRAAIEVWLDGELVAATTSDEEGRFTAKVPVTGGAELVLAGGHEGRLTDVTAGANDLVLRAAGDG